MILSNKHKFIFIHVPKVAGIAIKSALKKYGNISNSTYLNKTFKKIGVKPLASKVSWYFQTFTPHIPALELKKSFSQKKWEQFYKFAFVRNPYDWEVSHYFYIIQNNNHVMHDLVNELGSFDNYIEKSYVDRSSPLYHFMGKNILARFLTDDQGTLLVDYVGKFENINNDFDEICKTIGIKAQLQKKNVSRHSDYRSYYENPNLIEIVRKSHSYDFELFDYDPFKL